MALNVFTRLLRSSIYLCLTFLLIGCTNGKTSLSNFLDQLGTITPVPTLPAYAVTITKATTQSTPTSQLYVYYDVVFSEAIDPSTLSNTNFYLDATSSGSANTYIITNPSSDLKNYSLSIMTTNDGTYKPNITDLSVKTANGLNSFTAVAPTNNTVTIDRTPPSVTVNQAAGQADPTSAFPMVFNIQFSEEIDPTTFIVGDITQSGTASTVAWTLVDTGDHKNFIINATSAAAAGTIMPTIAASKVTDLAGNANTASTATDNVVTYTAPAAVLSISDGPSSYNFGTLYAWQVVEKTFTVTNNGALTATSMSGGSIGVPFAFKGGSYPGTGGSCGSTLAAGSNCTVIVVYAPTANSPHSSTVIVNYFDGTAANTATRPVNGTASIMSVSVVPFYTGNDKWNDYVKNDGADIFSSSGTLCTGSETDTMEKSCIHAGSLRKIDLPTVPSCSGLSATEPLGVFVWECVQNGAGVIYRTKGLQPNKGLRDLLSATAWLTNTVSIILNSTTIAQSTGTPWWSDGIAALPDNSGSSSVLNLNLSNQIYTVAADQATFGYQIASDRVSIATLGSALLTKNNIAGSNCNSTNGQNDGSNNIRAFFCTNTKKFIWLEVNADGTTGPSPSNAAQSFLIAYALKFSRIHRSMIAPLSPTGTIPSFSLNSNSQSNLITDLTIHNAANGVAVNSSQRNIFRQLKVNEIKSTSAVSLLKLSTAFANRFYEAQLSHMTSTNTGSTGITIDTFSQSNIFSKLKVNNINGSGSAIKMTDSDNNIINQAVLFATVNTGIEMGSSSSNVFSHITTGNNTWNGIYFNPGTTQSSNTFNSIAITNTAKNIEQPSGGGGFGNAFWNIASSEYDSYSIDINGAASWGTFSGYVIGGNFCGVHSGVTNITATCSNGSAVILGSIASSVKGPVTTESVNPTGTGVFASSSLSNLSRALADRWFKFENYMFRSWGQANTSFPSSTERGYCITTNCQVWDWRIKISSLLHNTSIAGNTANPTFTTGGSCISGLDGNASDTIISSLGTFLKNAVEIEGDSIGNDNGLCESNENCIYAPNVGAYQGEGTLNLSNYCTTSGASVNGAKIFAYPTTGI